MRRLRPTYSNVVATLALFVALGGTGYAAATITGADVRNSSLTGRDVRNSSLTSADIRNNRLTSADIRNGTLRASDFNAPELARLRGPQGPQGPRGATGQRGQTGPPGPTGPKAAVAAGEVRFGPTRVVNGTPGVTASSLGAGSACVVVPGASPATHHILLSSFDGSNFADGSALIPEATTPSGACGGGDGFVVDLMVLDAAGGDAGISFEDKPFTFAVVEP